MNIDRTGQIKYLLARCESLKKGLFNSLNDKTTNVSGRYSAFKVYAQEYKFLAEEVSKYINLNNECMMVYDISQMKGWADTLWPMQKEVMESTLIYTEALITILNREVGFVEDEYSNIENFIKNKLRTGIFKIPEKEKEVQDVLEVLFNGRGWEKGIDYDREAGKVEFSGREYIPDFIVPKLELCIEVKLLKEGRRSSVIEEINADITGYSKKYKRIMFVVYDLGCIQNETEFRRDIENAKENIKVVIVKH